MVFIWLNNAINLHLCMFYQKPSPESLTIVAPPFPWESEEFLNPTMPNDELLQYGMHCELVSCFDVY